ncbi:hypothetical protein BHM03_00041101 [Ensete ventricosum]|nr:hypothetical protein BHM03_00041101 [Ensete ventricosum]
MPRPKTDLVVSDCPSRCGCMPRPRMHGETRWLSLLRRWINGRPATSLSFPQHTGHVVAGLSGVPRNPPSHLLPLPFFLPPLSASVLPSSLTGSEGLKRAKSVCFVRRFERAIEKKRSRWRGMAGTGSSPWSRSRMRPSTWLEPYQISCCFIESCSGRGSHPSCVDYFSLSSLQERIPVEEVFAQLKCTREGLTDAEGEQRLQIFGPNKLEEKQVRPLTSDFSTIGGHRSVI